MTAYTRHAKDRMKQYGITEEEVEYCLNNYHNLIILIKKVIQYTRLTCQMADISR
ncbi:DUF4258 domain-containing protein [Dehalococcoidales bacterium]|nr:DUF4258 domain-containing protein [Dehalococcoidales bacterium]